MSSLVKKKKLSQASISYRSKLYHILDERNVIGRKEDGFLYIRDAFVSRNHCIIEKISDNNFTIRNRSKSGTFVNNKKLKKGEIRTLNHKDQIKLIDKERRVPMIFLLNSKLKIHGRMKKILLDLIRSQMAEMNKIDDEISEIELKKSSLEEQNVKLEAEEGIVGGKRMRFSRDVTQTKQDDEVEKQIEEEIEEKSNDEKVEKTQEFQMEISKLTVKEKELQQMKEDMEIRHMQEKEKLGLRWKAELDEMKERLADNEREKKLLKGKELRLKEKFISTRKLLLKSEIVQYKICKERFNFRPQQDILTKDNISVALMREMQKKLKEKEEAEENQKKDIAELEEELLCSICAEIFFEPKVLNCGHLFCKFCIKEWRKSRNSCPVCRAMIKSCIRIYSIDSIIEKNISMISNEAKERRKHLIKERSRVAVVRPTKRIKCPHMSNPFPTNRGTTSGLIMQINQQDQGIIVFSPNHRPLSDSWNISTNENGDRVYRYYVHGMRNPAPAAVTAPTSIPATDSTNPPVQSEPAQPQRRDGSSSTPISLIDLTNQ